MCFLLEGAIFGLIAQLITNILGRCLWYNPKLNINQNHI